MAQTFNVLQCFSCNTYQVEIVKKSFKWNCKICGKKQSVQKVFGEGSSRDCRLHVQKLNKLRGHTESLENSSLLQIQQDRQVDRNDEAVTAHALQDLQSLDDQSQWDNTFEWNNVGQPSPEGKTKNGFHAQFQHSTFSLTFINVHEARMNIISIDILGNVFSGISEFNDLNEQPFKMLTMEERVGGTRVMTSDFIAPNETLNTTSPAKRHSPINDDNTQSKWSKYLSTGETN